MRQLSTTFYGLYFNRHITKLHVKAKRTPDITAETTDRQTNSFTPYTWVCGLFLRVKFVTSLLASLAGGLRNDSVYHESKKLVLPKCQKCITYLSVWLLTPPF